MQAWFWIKKKIWICRTTCIVTVAHHRLLIVIYFSRCFIFFTKYLTNHCTSSDVQVTRIYLCIYVTFHGKTYTNGCPFKWPKTVNLTFTSRSKGWVIRSQKRFSRSNGWTLRSQNLFSRSNGWAIRSPEILTVRTTEPSVHKKSSAVRTAEPSVHKKSSSSR